jgi:hypothetical protein
MHTFGQTNVRMRREHLKRKAPGRIVFLKRLRLACSIRLICNHMENKPEDLMRRVGAQTTIGEHRRKRPSMTSFFTNHRCWLYHHGLHAGEIRSASSQYATLHRGASQLSIRNKVCDAKVKSWWVLILTKSSSYPGNENNNWKYKFGAIVKSQCCHLCLGVAVLNAEKKRNQSQSHWILSGLVCGGSARGRRRVTEPVKALLTVSGRGSLHEEGVGRGGSSASRRRSRGWGTAGGGCAGGETYEQRDGGA